MNKYLYPLLCAFFTAIAFLITETLIIHYGVEPITVAFLINFLGGAILALFVRNKLKHIKSMLHHKPMFLFVTSIFLYAMAYIFSYSGTELIGAAKISFALQLETLFIIFIAVLFLRERFRFRMGLAAVLIVLGGFLLNFSFVDYSFSFGSGELLLLLTAITFSIGIVMQTILLKEYDALFLSAIGLLLGGFMLFVIVVRLFGWTAFSFPWHLVLLMGVIEALIWLLYNRGLQVLGASKTSIVFGTVPFFTLLFSFAYNFFQPGFFQLPQNMFGVIFGGILMFLGIAVVYWGNRSLM